jgi:CubicO group peptidase (beta-lactamase class C family)
VLDTRFQAIAEAAAVAWEVPAIAIGVAVGEDVETLGIGCDAGTRFRLASVTKPFTATLALELLDLEETTGVWAADVRVRHLLSHTSGYDSELGDMSRFGDGDDALAAAVEELPAVRRWVGVEQAWSYSNAGYWLVGRLCAQAAGTMYEEAVAARILRALGLEATSFDEPADVPGTGRDAEEGPYPRARRPSGGLVSNVPDLLRFGRHHLETPGSARMRIVHGKPTGGVYGLGLSGERVGGVDVWGHGGSHGGYQSQLLLVPDRHAVFVGLSNGSVGKQALREIEDAFFERLVGQRRHVRETVELPEDVLEAFAGTYANSDAWTEVAVLPGGGLLLSSDEDEMPARPIAERTFEITEGDHVRDRFDFPLEGFGRFGGRLAERVS